MDILWNLFFVCLIKSAISSNWIFQYNSTIFTESSMYAFVFHTSNFYLNIVLYDWVLTTVLWISSVCNTGCKDLDNFNSKISCWALYIRSVFLYVSLILRKLEQCGNWPTDCMLKRACFKTVWGFTISRIDVYMAYLTKTLPDCW